MLPSIDVVLIGSHMKKFVALVGLSLLTLTATGCHVSSKTSMYGRGGRTAYNKATQNTTNQEILLNLVRLRYSDTPYFLEVNNVTTQFTYTGKVLPTVKIPGLDADNPAVLGAELAWQNQPTIQYSPLQGKDFAVQLMHPLDLRVIQGLIFTGWDVDRIFRLLVQNMANIQNACGASGPIPEEPPDCKSFFEVTDLLRYFQLRGELQIGVRYIPRGKSEPDDKGEIVKRKHPNTIQISFPSKGEKADRLAELLEGVQTCKGKYILNMRQDFNEQAEIGIMTRSLLSCMYYLSLGVNVPAKDLEAGTVGHTLNPDGKHFDWSEVIGDLITIESSPRQPDDSYLSVAYRGHWFYIKDTDVNSKRTFVLLQQIYNLQAKQVESEPPLLSIPLGGGT